MAIIGTLPSILANGTSADATQVMADFNFIVNQINANAAPVGALTAPSGTRTIFNQPAAPLGWTTDTTVIDHCLWVTNTFTGGGVNSAGSGYSSFLNGTWSTAGHALTAAEIPPHTHNISIPNVSGGGSTPGLGVGSPGGTNVFTTDGGTGGGAAHSHANSTAWNYIACVVAQKS